MAPNANAQNETDQCKHQSASGKIGSDECQRRLFERLLPFLAEVLVEELFDFLPLPFAFFFVGWGVELVALAGFEVRAVEFALFEDLDFGAVEDFLTRVGAGLFTVLVLAVVEDLVRTAGSVFEGRTTVGLAFVALAALRDVVLDFEVLFTFWSKRGVVSFGRETSVRVLVLERLGVTAGVDSTTVMSRR